MWRTTATFAHNWKYFSVAKYKAVATKFYLCTANSVFSVLCRPCLCSVGSSQPATAAAVCAAAVIVAVGSVNRNLPKARSRNSMSLQRTWRHSCSQMKGVGENTVSSLG